MQQYALFILSFRERREGGSFFQAVLATWHIRVRRFGACEIAREGQKVESNKAF